MISKNLKIQFLFKLLTKYFLFGYLCLVGIILLVRISLHVYKTFGFPKNLFSIIFILFSIPIVGQLLRIIFSIHYKYRYYKISLYRLMTRGYQDKYFECEMHEPCFRLIIKDLLISNGYSKEYYLLKNKSCGKNLRVERAKEKLLAKVMREHAENMI